MATLALKKRREPVAKVPYGARLAGFGSRITNLFRTGPLPKATPFSEQGVSGTAVYGGLILQRERDARLVGPQKWITFTDLMVNTSIVAAGTRYMLNLISYAKWKVEPADDSPAAKQIAELFEDVIQDTATPWRRIVRRSAMYRFHGFGIQEWTAKKRDDGKVGFDDIEARPQHTIERWELDDNGSVVGVWQRAPIGGALLYIPRSKVMYMVDDTLTDSPEGIGLYRHLIEPWERLKKYFELEGRGFERDLRGIPIGRVPYTAIRKAVQAGQLTKEDATGITQAVEDFVKMQSKSNDTSIVMDSAPYIVETDSGPSVSSAMQFGVELLQGGSVGFAEIGQAIDRTILEMARILGVENLLLGDKGGGSRALASDKSQNFYLVVNGTLDEITDACNKDVIEPLCDLNGIKDELRPKLKHSELAFRTVQEITASLAQMATAGAVLRPDDPAIDDVRDLLGIERQPEPDMDMYQQQQQAKAGMKFGPDGKPVDPVKMAEATARAKFAGQTPGQPGGGGGQPGGNGGTQPSVNGSQPPAKSGGKGSAGNQNVTNPKNVKKFFDLDDVESWDEEFTKANRGYKPRDSHGRFTAGFGSASSSPGIHEHPQETPPQPSAFANVPGLKGKVLRTKEWLSSEPVKQTVKNESLFIAKEAIGHILTFIAGTAIEHKLGSQDPGLHQDVRNFIYSTVHHFSRSTPEGQPKPGALDYVTLAHARAALHLAIQVFQKLRESEIKKADETDPILEILQALQEDLDNMGSDEDLSKAFNPDEPRDKSGKWATTVFHGTNEKTLSQIMREGLKPQGGKGADRFIMKGMSKAEKQELIRDTKGYVYVSFDWEQAAGFADLAAEINKSEPVILEIKIPKEEFDKRASADVTEGFTGKNSDFKFKGEVKPEWIVGIAKEPTTKVFNERIEKGLSDSVTLFMVLIPKKQGSVEKANPYHDGRGRFTDVAGARRPITASRHAATLAMDQEYAQKAATRSLTLKHALSVTAAVAGLSLVDRAFEVAKWFRTSSSAEVLKDHASVLGREGVAQLASHLLNQATKDQGVPFSAPIQRQVNSLIERTVLGEAQQRDITIGQARATVKVFLNLLKAYRKGQIEKVQVDASDPVVAILDYLIGMLDDMDQRENDEQALPQETIAKITRFIEDGEGLEIIAQEILE